MVVTNTNLLLLAVQFTSVEWLALCLLAFSIPDTLRQYSSTAVQHTACAAVTADGLLAIQDTQFSTALHGPRGQRLPSASRPWRYSMM